MSTSARHSLDSHPLFRLGFRPFYFLAAIFAAVSVPLWIVRYFGLMPALKHVNLNWHVHEMVFGFAIAVIIGFVYTAGRNWTGLWTPRGRHLAALWIAGRVIPGFTANAVPGVKPVTHARRDQVILAFTALTCIAWVANLPPVLTASLALAAAVSQVMRLAGWKTYRTLGNPLLWILHISYGWIPVGFALLGLASLQIVSVSAAFHVLAIGPIAGLIIGMITRTALGHTGRPLRAGRTEVWMYCLVQLGLIARFWAAIDVAGGRDTALLVSAASWSAAFLLYALVYGRYLFAARVEGREG